VLTVFLLAAVGVLVRKKRAFRAYALTVAFGKDRLGLHVEHLIFEGRASRIHDKYFHF
jgi:hypothetical protein